MLEGHNCSLDGLYDAVVKKEPKSLKPDLAKKIKAKSEEIQKTKNERAKTVKSAELAALIQEAQPASIGRKIGSVQTMAQLLNPKTAIRNVIGNGIFAAVDTSSNALAAVMDNALSRVTGNRTRVLPRLGAAAKGFKQGAIEGYQDAIRGVDTAGGGNKFDIPQGFTFKNSVLQGLEKAMAVELKASDRAFYQMARNESLLNQLKASGGKEITEEMIAAAHEEALYKTFQDDSAAAKLFTGIKRALNFNKDFGLGDFVLKYPKTPGNLLSRAFAYSPTGFLKTLHLAAEPFMKGTPFNQRAFVDSFSRATVGTGLIGSTGYMLGKLGIATGAADKDADIRAIKRKEGMAPYSLNASALMRFALTYNPKSAKPQKNDVIYTYDWAQPIAVPFSAAVGVAQTEDRKTFGKTLTALETAGTATLEATDTLTQQGVVQGLQKLFSKNGSISKGALEIAGDAPASFVPSAINQANQLTDNKLRDTSGDGPIGTSINKVKAKIPGLAQTLPERKDVYGETAERYQDGGNNLLNVAFSPGFMTTLKEDPTGKEILRLYKETGLAKQAPKLVEKSVKIRNTSGNPVNRSLTSEEHSAYQEFMGQNTKKLFDRTISSPFYRRLSEEGKANALSQIMTDVNQAAKKKLFQDKPDRRLSLTAMGILNNNPNLAFAGVRKHLIQQLRTDYKKHRK